MRTSVLKTMITGENTLTFTLVSRPPRLECGATVEFVEVLVS